MDENIEEKRLIEARREARRKRILENAEKRLKLITGTDSTEVFTEKKDEVTEKVILDERFSEIEPILVVDEVQTEPPPPRIHEPRRRSKKPQEPPVTSIFEHFNVLIVLVAILTRFLINYLNEAILMPFITLEALALCFHKRKDTNSLIGTVLLLTNLPRRQIKSIMYAVSLSEVVIKDFCAFFFVFLTCHVLTEMIF